MIVTRVKLRYKETCSARCEMRVMEGLTTVVIVIKTMLATRVLSKTVSANSPIQQASGNQRRGESWAQGRDGAAAPFPLVPSGRFRCAFSKCPWSCIHVVTSEIETISEQSVFQGLFASLKESTGHNWTLDVRGCESLDLVPCNNAGNHSK